MNFRFTQLKYKCPCLLCPCSRCVQTMQANLVNGLYIKSTGSHEVLHHGQVTKIGCKVQGCVSVLIRVKEVALHFGGKVLSNGKMAFHDTQVKGISSALQWMIGQAHNRSQPVHAWFTVDDSMHLYQTPCQGAYSIRTAIRTTYLWILHYTTSTLLHDNIQYSNLALTFDSHGTSGIPLILCCVSTLRTFVSHKNCFAIHNIQTLQLHT